jgi:hypothetical protein
MALENHLDLVRTGQTIAYHFGFVDYNDEATAIAPINITGGVWTRLTNDGQGVFTNLRYSPDGVLPLMDTSSGAITPYKMPLGSDLKIRTDFTITPNSNNASLKFRYSLGSGLDSYTLEKSLGRLDEGAGVPYRQSLNVDYIYMGDENTRDHPIYLEVLLSTNGTVTNSGMAIEVDLR